MSDKKILIKCLYCGKELDDTVEICHECEEKIQLFSHVSKQNKRTLIIIGMLFLLIIVITIIILLLYMNIYPIEKQFDEEEQINFFFYLLGTFFIQMILGSIAIERGSISTQNKLSQGLIKEKDENLRSLGIFIVIIYSLVGIVLFFFLAIIYPLLGM